MKAGVDRDRVILAFKKAIKETFDEGRWYELGYTTSSIGIIDDHPRLLRSMRFRDPDYDMHIFKILPSILGEDLGNLKTVEELVGLEDWLRRNDPELHAELYGMESVALDVIEEKGVIHSVHELTHQVARIKASIQEDSALAVGSAKDLLETVMKTILGKGNYDKSHDIPTLLKRVQTKLCLDPKALDRTTVGGEKLARTLSNLGQIVVGVDEMRNLVGTGHGRSGGPTIDRVHASLVVNSASSIATYLLEIWEQQGKP